MLRYKGFSTREISSLVNHDVVEFHLEDAAFNWLLRNNARDGTSFRLKDLADTDEKVDANLDGLYLAGDEGWRLCVDKLEEPEPWELFAAAVMAFKSRDAKRINRLYEVDLPDPPLEQALASALGWLPCAEIEQVIASLVISMKPAMRRLGIAGGAVHRKSSKQDLLNAMNDSDNRTRARAVKAAGEEGFVDLVPAFIGLLEDEDETCRYYTAWAAALLGYLTEPVLSELRQVALSGKRYSTTALKVAVLGMSRLDSEKWCRTLLADDSTKRHAVIATGVIGAPAFIPELIDLMHDDDLSRVAGEAFSLITGVDLEVAGLTGDAPEKETLAFEDDLADDPDEELPYPDAAAVARWWDDHHTDFRSGDCYLLIYYLRNSLRKNKKLSCLL